MAQEDNTEVQETNAQEGDALLEELQEAYEEDLPNRQE